MGKCVSHTDRETNFFCSKHIVYMCEECLRCRDPKQYCKFRTACPVWFMQKLKEHMEKERKIEEEEKVCEVTLESDNIEAYKEIAMPIYEYKCEKCNHSFERLVFKSDNQDIDCPKCGDIKKVKKLLSPGRLMSGSGFGSCGPSASRGFS